MVTLFSTCNINKVILTSSIYYLLYIGVNYLLIFTFLNKGDCIQLIAI